MDRVAGYDPADEGSSPSPNTFRADNRELLFEKTSRPPTCSFFVALQKRRCRTARGVSPLYGEFV